MSLLVLGSLAAAAGVAMVGFGIPINEFGFGNTLIIAGTTALVGGLLLIGLADAVRQLRRIADSLMARSSPRMPRWSDPAEPPAPAVSRNGGSGRIPFPPKPATEGRRRGTIPIEPRVDVDTAPSIDAGDEDAFERPRPSMIAPEPRVFPDRNETPLSPQEPNYRSSESMMDKVPEPRDTDLTAGLLTAEMLRMDVSTRPVPPSEDAPQNEFFDSLWPADTRKSKAPTVEPEPQPSEEGVASENAVPDQAAAEPHAVSILKSGVVDGMAYTLYSDGSIEAELPQGTVRFASITELRAYLEKSS